MYLAYFDESGDNGYPKYSSELFVLTSVYMHFTSWKENYNKMVQFRRWLKKTYKFPVKLEFHTKAFLTDKNPYRDFRWDNTTKKDILYDYFRFMSTLDIKIINVVINKKNIILSDYPILDKALTYIVQRIENDIKNIGNNFVIITDEGRVGKMRNTTRRIQRINYIPSKIHPGTYRQEIERLIEDPVPKQSAESYFIQIADIVSYIVYLYSLKEFNQSKWANRVKNKLTIEDVHSFLKIIENRLNLKASSTNEFGIVHYPKKP